MEQAGDEALPRDAVMSVEREEAEAHSAASDRIDDEAHDDRMDLQLSILGHLDDELDELALGRRVIHANEQTAIARVEHLDGLHPAATDDVRRQGDTCAGVSAAVFFLFHLV